MLNSTLSTASNAIGIKTDASINIMVLIAIIALISPIIVAVINNWFQGRERMREREFERDKYAQEVSAEKERLELELNYKIKIHKYNSYYKNQTVAYEQLLEIVGDFLGDNTDMEKYAKSMACVNKAYIYADTELMEKLDNLRIQVGYFGGITEGDYSIITALNSLKNVANQINKELKKNADMIDAI
ncbi:MAG: hypothetical protein LUK37_23055 [Clostridia bacterium]|nr:hypothetical protein [Clostridia bacterium]